MSAEAADTKDSLRRERLAGASVMVLGLLIVVSLLRYNLQPNAVWSSTSQPAGQLWEEYLLVNITGLLLFPALAILLIHRRPLQNYGLGPAAAGSARKAAALFALMLPVLVLASRMPAFQAYYPIQKLAAENLRYLVYFEATYGLYLFCWEFFFRGFLIFGIARATGFPIAVALQSVGFCAMHLGKPMPELLGSLVAGVVLGVLAVQAKSCLPGFLAHWGVASCFDLLVIQATPGGLF